MRLGRTSERWLMRFAAVATCAVTTVVGAASPSLASSGWKWTQNTQYGVQGEAIDGNGLTVDDVLGRFIPPSRDFFTGHAWRFVITRYSCDPRHHSKAACKPQGIYHSKLRKGNPPAQGSSCVSLAPNGIGRTYCEEFGLASVYASHSDYPGLTVPRAFASGTWLCTEIQLNSNTAGTGKWTYNGNASNDLRACAEVKA